MGSKKKVVTEVVDIKELGIEFAGRLLVGATQNGTEENRKNQLELLYHTAIYILTTHVFNSSILENDFNQGQVLVEIDHIKEEISEGVDQYLKDFEEGEVDYHPFQG